MTIREAPRHRVTLEVPLGASAWPGVFCSKARVEQASSVKPAWAWLSMLPAPGRLATMASVAASAAASCNVADGPVVLVLVSDGSGAPLTICTLVSLGSTGLWVGVRIQVVDGTDRGHSPCRSSRVCLICYLVHRHRGSVSRLRFASGSP